MSVHTGTIEYLGSELLPPKGTRDLFAASALTGLLARYHWHATPDPYRLAKEAFAMADAMLKERAK